jgi:hypothetical protein
LEALLELTIYLGLCAADQVHPGHDDEIEAHTFRGLEPAEALPQEAAGAIPSDGPPELPARGDAEPMV